MEKRYTCEEVAEYYHVKVTTVYDWIKRGHSSRNEDRQKIYYNAGTN